MSLEYFLYILNFPNSFHIRSQNKKQQHEKIIYIYIVNSNKDNIWCDHLCFCFLKTCSWEICGLTRSKQAVVKSAMSDCTFINLLDSPVPV